MNRPLFSRSRPLYVVAFLAASVLGLTACGENIFDIKWTVSRVSTVLLYSLARPELNLPSGFDFVDRREIEIQQPGVTGLWDLLVDTQDGQLVFVPPGALGIDSEVMVLPIPDMAGAGNESHNGGFQRLKASACWRRVVPIAVAGSMARHVPAPRQRPG